jgi:hypothetical protein
MFNDPWIETGHQAIILIESIWRARTARGQKNANSETLDRARHCLRIVTSSGSATALLGGVGSATLAQIAARRRADDQRAVRRKVDVLLRLCAHAELRNVDHLRADANVTLSDHDARVVNRLGEAEFVHLRLQPTLEEVLTWRRQSARRCAACAAYRNRQRQNKIEFHLVLVQNANSAALTNNGRALEHAARIFLIQCEQNTAQRRAQTVRSATVIVSRTQQTDQWFSVPSCFAELGDDQLGAPDLLLCAQTKLAAQLEFLVDTFLLERTPRRLPSLGV